MEISFKNPQHASILGNINEDADFRPLVDATSSPLVIDLGGVRRINSSGVKRWLDYVRGIRADQKVILESCPVSFITQANLIVRFLGTARVSSLLLPLWCPSCESASERMTAISEVQEGVEPGPCAKCGAATELDVEPAEYFAFLES